MPFPVVRGVDLLAVAGAVAAVGVAVVYLSIIEDQGGGAATWFVVLLGVVALLCLLAAPAGVRSRAALLFLAAFLMGGAGVLAILSIGLLVLAAGFFPGLAFLFEVTKPPLQRSAPEGVKSG